MNQTRKTKNIFILAVEGANHYFSKEKTPEYTNYKRDGPGPDNWWQHQLMLYSERQHQFSGTANWCWYTQHANINSQISVYPSYDNMCSKQISIASPLSEQLHINIFEWLDNCLDFCFSPRLYNPFSTTLRDGNYARNQNVFHAALTG